MYVKVHGTKDYVKGNSQGCKDLVDYLNKENEGKELLDREFFFNQHQEHITDTKVIDVIDNNHKGLKKADAKFYMISVNPSERELKYMAELATGRKIEHISQMTKVELERYNSLFKDYVNKVMDEYANSFNRGITKDNLHYFAKIEQQRKYKGFEREVKENLVKSGDLKPGLQTHAHVVVSRMDVEQKISLSPHSKSRGHSKNHKLNGKSVQQGFDNVAFKVNSEKVFDKTFGYSRQIQEKAAYRMLQNNAYKVLGFRKDVNMGKAIINQRALEFFTRQLGEKTVSALMNANPYLKAAYKAVRLAKQGIDIILKI
ncbi:MAG: mobilization protein [Ignavibacteria bacterium]|nr:mobilization protein [Ignavibacteria bacterium]